ncbi:MAG: copper-binding protein, partial [Rhodothermales bacterium]
MLESGFRSGILLCLLLILAACGRERTYEGRGRVAGFGDDGLTIIVEHEEIEGFMPAMTMPFSAAVSSEISGLNHGDAISFRLSVSSGKTRISDILRLSDDALPEHPASSLDPQSTSGEAPPHLDSGDPVPLVELTTHADTTLTFTELQGRTVVLTFVYTRCPLPEFCPL